MQNTASKSGTNTLHLYDWVQINLAGPLLFQLTPASRTSIVLLQLTSLIFALFALFSYAVEPTELSTAVPPSFNQHVEADSRFVF